ncbi:MAG: sulfatase-like hydrolase/transferase, partial [Thermoguttaceae bacterium]|nr:sulfatase-like hydrolase/transferase [Thermoguttaceae bacterium]
MTNFNRTSSVSGKNILCLAVDRLNADFLGAYGNAWVETPAFDALAAESVLFDSFFATSLDLETLYRAFWRGESPARVVASTAADAAPPSIFRLLKEKGYRTFVVSDDETVALHPAVEDEFCDGRFFLGSPDAALPAETLEETQFFRNFEELARFLAKLEDDAKRADGGDAAPWFVWAHFSGWNERWDFPLELRERFQEDEDDPAPYSATLVPYWPLEETAKSAKRGARVDENAVVEAALARAAAILDADAENAASIEAASLPAEVEIELNVEFDDAEAPDAQRDSNAGFDESDDEAFENDDAFLDESAVERRLAATEL